MLLENTTLTLKRFHKRYGNYVKNATRDIKPDYSERGLQPGYSYKGYDDKDREYIYYKVREMDCIFHDSNGVIRFDIENEFITEKRAVEELISTKQFIEEVLTELKEIEKRNVGREYSKYPLQVCFGIFSEVNDILQEIFDHEEMISFLNPRKLKSLEDENILLKFNVFWRKKILRCSIHLLFFIPFIFACGYVILNKEDENIIGIRRNLLLIIGGILTIIFNILFNNHNSFKDSFKLIFPSSRKKLKQEEFEKFKKAQ